MGTRKRKNNSTENNEKIRVLNKSRNGRKPVRRNLPTGADDGREIKTKENKMKERISIQSGEYIDFINKAIRSDGYHIADIANKLALESKQISTDQYLQAARIIAKAFLESVEIAE